ncbi:MAG: hypothetical protein Aureis2KO_05240 [Aureisphaera sp.]
MQKLFFIIGFVAFTIPIKGQILNAESLRKVTDTSGWSGSASAHFAIKRNVNDFVILGSDIHIQYKMDKHLLLFKNDINFTKIEGDKFENAGITHVRHNYRFHQKIAWEVFTQGQYNKVSLIDFRGLLGTGPRFKLTNSENYKFYLGTLVMFEYEEIADNFTPIQRDLRGSSYLSFSIYPSERISLISTTYYQPLLREFSDYRISSQSSFAVELFGGFDIKLTYTFVYDAVPALGIQNSQYDFRTGFSYSFD